MKRSEVRSVDQIAMKEFQMSGLVLMENAGRGAAEQIDSFLASRGTPNRSRIRILCGTGNNGGDGYVIARHLELLGHDVGIVSLVEIEKLGGDAAANATIAQLSGLPIAIPNDAECLDTMLEDDDVIVDCMLGTGARGEPRGLYRDAITKSNSIRGHRIAIDIPTGLDCDSGIPSDATFKADLTITFVAAKQGFHSSDAREYTGEVRVVGIGVPKRLLNRFNVATPPESSDGECR